MKANFKNFKVGSSFEMNLSFCMRTHIHMVTVEYVGGGKKEEIRK